MAGNDAQDAPGTMEGDRGDAKATPSGLRGDNPATAGTGARHVRTQKDEHAAEALDPSSPGETGTTPGSTGWA